MNTPSSRPKEPFATPPQMQTPPITPLLQGDAIYFTEDELAAVQSDDEPLQGDPPAQISAQEELALRAARVIMIVRAAKPDDRQDDVDLIAFARRFARLYWEPKASDAIDTLNDRLADMTRQRDTAIANLRNNPAVAMLLRIKRLPGVEQEMTLGGDLGDAVARMLNTRRELLEALKTVINPAHCIDAKDIQSFRNAIAKAEGGAQ